MNVYLQRSIALVASASLLVACTGDQGGATKTTGQPSVGGGSAQGAPSSGARVDTGTDMPGMSGMPEMSNTADSLADGMPAEMRSHMQRMRSASEDSLTAMLPIHRQMVANMLARMNGEMRQMNMPANAQWNATVDSLRQDLIRMPEIGVAELRALMPAHDRRVSSLAAMHAAMMRDMR